MPYFAIGVKRGVFVNKSAVKSAILIDYYIEGRQMNKLAYMIFGMCIAISGCGMDEKSATQEESSGDSPVEASTDAVITTSEAVEEAIEEVVEGAVDEAEAVADEVEQAVIPIKGSSGEIGVGSSIQKKEG